MAKDKKSFILYADLIHSVKHLPKEKAGELFMHILSYVNDENPVTDDLILNISFEPIKQQLKRDLRKFETKKEVRSEAGKKGAEKRWQNEAKDGKTIKPMANIAVTVTDNVTVTDTANVTDTVINFFKINGKVFNEKVSDYFKANFSIFFESWQMQNKQAKIEKIFLQMDTDYNGYDFTDQNHIQNTFKSTAKKINNDTNKKGNGPDFKPGGSGAL